jgi:hypothetical protein
MLTPQQRRDAKLREELKWTSGAIELLELLGYDVDTCSTLNQLRHRHDALEDLLQPEPEAPENPEELQPYRRMI